MHFLRAPILAALMAILTAACHSAPPEDLNNLVLRTYDVPKGSARAVVSTLGDAFWMGDQKLIGRATITPDGRLEPLLYRTALNLASNRRRSWRIWGFIGIDAASAEASPAPSSEEALATAQTRQRVRAAIEALPERLREVILLTEYSELTHQDIGKALGIPAGTVGSRRNTAIAQLSEQLGEVEGLA